MDLNTIDLSEENKFINWDENCDNEDMLCSILRHRYNGKNRWKIML